MNSKRKRERERGKGTFAERQLRKWLENGTAHLGKDEQAIGNGLPDTKYIILLSAGKLARRLAKTTVYEFLMQKKNIWETT
jgi:hypothetical protein